MTVSKEAKLVIQILSGIGTGIVAYLLEQDQLDNIYDVVGVFIVAVTIGWAAGTFIDTPPA